MLPMTKFGFKQGFASLPKKAVSAPSLENLQKAKKCHSPTLRTVVFDLKLASKPFSKMLPVTNFGFKQGFATLPKKTVSTPSHENLQKTEKCHSQTLRTLVFDFKVASKRFSKKIPMTNF